MALQRQRAGARRSWAAVAFVAVPCAFGFVSLPKSVFTYGPLPKGTAGPTAPAGRSSLTASMSANPSQKTHLPGALASPKEMFITGTLNGGGGVSAAELSPGLALALENARRLSEDGAGELGDLEFMAAPGDAARRNGVLERAYKECERITSIFAKTFYLGTTFMPDDARKAVWAIYVWCRRTDDIVDGPRAMVRGMKSMEADLDDWTARLEDVWRGKPRDALDLALVDVKARYPTLSIAPFKDMVDGMLMDVPGHGKSRYASFEELELYCYRVAGTVGLMTLPVLGTASGVTEEEAKAPALSLGIALQLTNILRDVGEDAVRGRIYLPQEDMARFGVPEENVLNGILDDNYRSLMRFQIERARYYYRQAARGIPLLAPNSRLPVQASLDMYSRILMAIEENGYDNFRKRAYVSKTDKLLTLPSSWWKSLNPPALVPETDPQWTSAGLRRFDRESRAAAAAEAA